MRGRDDVHVLGRAGVLARLVPACLVVLTGCFDYGLPYPGDGTVDTAPEPDVADSQDLTDPDVDPDTVFDLDADPDTTIDTGDETDVEEDTDVVVDSEDDADAVIDSGLDTEDAVDSLVDPDTVFDPDADPDTVVDPDVDPDTMVDPDADPDTVLDPDVDFEPDAPPTLPAFVVIPAGSFTMGSTAGEPGRNTDETQHSVTLTRPFEIMMEEVTQDQFFTVLGYRPSSFGSCGGTCPVELVSWHEAAAYANAFSSAAGLAACYTCTGSGPTVSCTPSTTYSTPYDCPGYRLPTESEWERAARAGTTGATYNGTSTLLDCTTPNSVLDPIAWFCGNSAVSYTGCVNLASSGGPSCAGTNPVGGKTPNAGGLYDMPGNVWEWCSDWVGTYPGAVTDPWGPGTGTNRSRRGGSWRNDAAFARAAERNGYDPALTYNNIGFRLARTLPVTTGFAAIPAGTFTMGAPTTEPGRHSDETQHSVTLTRPFEMKETEVTQDEFYAVLGYTPSYFSTCGGSCAVTEISWYEAAAYANAMSASAGLAECYTCTGSGPTVSCTPSTAYSTPYECPGYRLPTEAEWERAARAGTTTGTYNGNSALRLCESPNTVLDPIAWFCGNSGVSYTPCVDLSSSGGSGCAGPHPAGAKAPNAWGLHDMVGNLYEWCHDWYGTYPGTVTDPWGPGTGTGRVCRSGYWGAEASYIRAAERNGTVPGAGGFGQGFRLARTLSPTAGFAAIPAGTFTMGSPVAEPGRDTDETEHSVTLSRSFEMMETEVTQDQFYDMLAYRPSSFGSCGGDCPVERVSWHEAAAYANALSASASLAQCYTCTGSGTTVSCTPSTTYSTPHDCPGYRLPTEAEWEYAARAGTTTGTYNGTSTYTDCTMPNDVVNPIAWFCGNSGPSTHPVGDRTPNAWGLYDILGNVWEWCSDWHDTYPGTVTDPWGPGTGSTKVIRSGSWGDNARGIRAADRINYTPILVDSHLGFRLVRTLP